MGALIHTETDAPSARYINPIVSVLKNETAHVDNIHVGQWSSASVPTARFRNANTSGKSLVAFAANASTEILACTNTGVTMAGTLNVTGAAVFTGALTANGGILTTTLVATGNVTLGDAAGVDTLTVNAIETHNGASTFNNSLVSESTFLSNGATTLGNAAADALTVNATSSFLSPVTVSGTFATESTTTLGNAAGDVITVNGTSTFVAGATFSSTLDVDGAATFDSNVTLGNAAGDAITVTGTATFAQTPLFQAQIDVQGGTAGSIRVGAVIVGAAALDGTEELLVNGQSRLKGAVTVTTSGIDVTGSSVFQSGLTITTGGLTITAGGLTVTSGGATLDAAPSTPAANVGYRESFAKGWVKFNTSGTILAELNVNSITDSGAGNWTVNWDRDFSSSDYAVVATAQGTWAGGDTTTWNAQVHDAAVTGGATQILTMRVSDGALSDPTAVHVIAMGTQ